ncbi:MAG: hypothetical protein KatS3mg053_1311 [Candidatus Roseilinea sp.]|nr:MAG: hypothetical protein KatS3mg053_1311 [Candidatus Roseilinea sp.]
MRESINRVKYMSLSTTMRWKGCSNRLPVRPWHLLKARVQVENKSVKACEAR